MAYTSWRGSFVALGLLGLVWVALWWSVFRDDPRMHASITAGELAQLPPTPTRDAGGNAPSVPWFKLARRMLPVTAVDFCYGWTLWVFLTWLPSFFFKNFHLDLKHSALFSSGVLLGGMIGDTVGGAISDWLYRRTGSLQVARRNLIVVGMLGAFCFLIPVVMRHDLTTVALCLSAACFFSEWVVAPIWSVPMDIASALRGIRQRHDEFRLRHRRNHFAGGFRRFARLDRQLDGALLRIDGVAVIGCRPCILHASRPAVHGEPVEEAACPDSANAWLISSTSSWRLRSP